MWFIPILIFVLAILQFSLIKGIYGEKVPKILAFYPVVSPIIGLILIFTEEKFAVYFLLFNFALIFLIVLSNFVKSTVKQRVNQKNSTKIFESPAIKEIFGDNEITTESKGLNNPIYSLIFRILLIIVIILGANENLDHNFAVDLHFQIFGAIALFLLAVGLSLKNLNHNNFQKLISERAKSVGKEPPPFITNFDFQKFAKTIYWMLGIAFLSVSFLMKIPQQTWEIIKNDGFPYIIYALLSKFAFDFFAVQKNPLQAILINSKKILILFQNYIMAIFVGIVLVVSLSVIGLKDAPFMLLGFNGVLLYEDFLTFKKSKK